MKNFISKNWKNIFFIIGGIFILVDLILIFTTPATVPQDFLEYGPNVESDFFDKVNDASDELSNVDVSGETSSIINNVSESTGMSPALAKGLLFFGIALAVVIIIANIADGSDNKPKKK